MDRLAGRVVLTENKAFFGQSVSQSVEPSVAKSFNKMPDFGAPTAYLYFLVSFIIIGSSVRFYSDILLAD